MDGRIALLGTIFVLGCSQSTSPPERAGGSLALSCSYTSPFTRASECRQYPTTWDEADIDTDCSELGGTRAIICETAELLGQCALKTEAGLDYIVFAYGEGGCDLQKAGCEMFGGGTWTDATGCSGDGGDAPAGRVFIPPTRECQAAIDGEPEGASEDGLVCTWQSISGSTEENRSFSDYASCDIVRNQRPYYPALPAETVGQADARMNDASYLAELNWVRSQIVASGCVCCHSALEAPQGTSNWYIEAPGNWITSMADSGVALGANAISSIAFGAYPPEQNNGFDRILSGFPSTDPDRMVQFFQDELAHRGLSDEDFAEAPGFGGPLNAQLYYEPKACKNGEGVNADGSITWTGGAARYLYVLKEGSNNPTVPPNLDRPDGTLWRVDVPFDGDPMEPGTVNYGVVPTGATQAIPAEGEVSALEAGEKYYLYVTLDVGVPVTRCLFTAPQAN